MPEARQQVAVTSHNGLIYVFGGADDSGGSTAIPYVYDPTNDSWSTRAPDSIARRCTARAVTLNNLIHLLGGWAGCDSSFPTNSHAIFDPATNTWSTAAPMLSGRGNTVAVAINGKIYVASGGNYYPGMVTQTEIYDPGTDSWSVGAPMPDPVRNAGAAVLSGKLYIVGGVNSITNTLKTTVQIFDPTTDSWSLGSPMPTARQLLEVGAIDGKLYVAGGHNGVIGEIDILEIYDSATNTWSVGPPMNEGRSSTGSTVVDSKFYIAAGFRGDPYRPLNGLEVFTPDGDDTPPSITIASPSDGGTYLLGQPVNASYSCEDEAGGSGLASCLGTVADGGAIDTGSVGTKTFTVNAEDNDGNTSSQEVTYNVIYSFTGFFQPVDSLPALNVANAGGAIPVKFGLTGNQGLGIFAAGYPASGQIACDAMEPGTVIEETVSAGGSSLSYDAMSDQYKYVWKTNKGWKGTCRVLVVRFIDGTDHLAKFKFK